MSFKKFLKKKRTFRKLGTIAHYIGVLSEYLVVIFFALWINSVLKFLKFFIFPLNIFGGILIIFGVLLIVWSCWLQFRLGKGTTGFSEPTKNLVSCGPYGIVRNPMMEGQFLFFTGIGILLDLMTMFLILPLLILATHLFTIYVEEPDLKRRFGQEWESYYKNVNRWIPIFRKTKKSVNVE